VHAAGSCTATSDASRSSSLTGVSRATHIHVAVLRTVVHHGTAGAVAATAGVRTARVKRRRIVVCRTISLRLPTWTQRPQPAWTGPKAPRSIERTCIASEPPARSAPAAVVRPRCAGRWWPRRATPR
jgi:hypothetical protein